MKTRKFSNVLAVCMLLVLAGCREKIHIPVDELTKDGYFTLLNSSEKGKYGPVIIFPERHDSRLIQAEFAWAFDVLLEKCGINTIALEGMFDNETLTANLLMIGTETENRDVTLAMLERGEIKAPEFMYLVNNSFVFGIEDEGEYAVTISDDARRALFQSLILSVAVDQDDEIVERGWALLEDGIINIIEFFSLNPWTQETLEIINKSMSIPEVIKRLKELEEKTVMFMDVKTRTDFRQYKIFYDVAYQRSITMAANVNNTLRKNNEPLAMIIGAAHTDDITEYFDKNKVSYYVLEPSGLNADDIWSDLMRDEYNRKGEEKSVFGNNHLEEFLSGRNSRPVIWHEWFKRNNELFHFFYKMIDWAFSVPPPDTLGADIIGGNGLLVPRNSIERLSPNDIMFRVENEKGGHINVRIVQNEQISPSANLRDALQEMIERLSQIDEASLSFRERIAALTDVVTGFNLGNCAVFISHNADVLRELGTHINYNRF